MKKTKKNFLREIPKFNFVFILLIISFPLFFHLVYLFPVNSKISTEKSNYIKKSNSEILIYNIDINSPKLTISSNGQYFIVASDNKIYYFNKDYKSSLWNFSCGGDGNSIHFLSMSSDGRNILVGSDTGRIYFFKNETSNLIWYYYLDDPWMDPLVGKISSNGNFIVVGSGTYMYTPNITGRISFFNSTNSIPLWNYTINETIISVDISSDGQHLVAGARNNRIYLFESNDSTPLWSYKTGGDVRSVAISGDGQYIIAGSDDNNAYLFSRNSSVPLWNYTAKTDVRHVDISKEGEKIVIGTFYNIPRFILFERKDPNPKLIFSPDHIVSGAAISSNGQFFAFSSRDKVFFFKNSSNSPLWSYSTNGYVYDISMSSNGEYVLVGSNKVYLLPKNLPLPPDLRFIGLLIIGVVGAAISVTFVYFLHLALFHKDKKV